MVCLGLIVVPHVEGRIHIMANPVYAYSTEKVVENGQRELLALPSAASEINPLQALHISVKDSSPISTLRAWF